MIKIQKIVILALACLACIFALSGCTSGNDMSKDISSSSATVSNETSQQATYDYSKPVPRASEWVKKAYFDDAVFIGDSVSTGISIYEYMQNSTVYAAKGISPENIFTKQCIDLESNKITIMQAMESTSFNKIYILLGANAAEFMTTDNFKIKYGEIIDKLKVIQPQAKIYIQSVFPITKTLSDKYQAAGSDFTNKKIVDYNAALLALATEKQVYYVNVFEALTDESGALPNAYSPDGVHINASQYQLWFDYLRTHTVG